jgi:predicted lipid-binding transport protein (Tim44 family)
MRFVSLVAALGVFLGMSVRAHGQAGRYIPAPRVPIGGGGGGGGFPHIPFSPGGGGGDLFWVLVAIAVIVVLAAVGWNLGQALAGRKSPAPPNGSPSMSPTAVPPLEDLIIRPEEVSDKALKTTRLLDLLAKYDAAFNPYALREFISATFTRVQQCWEARDYGPVRAFLGPTILAHHEELLRSMGRNREINRIEDPRVLRLEFVHVWCSPEADREEVTALITFEAKVYFVNERNRAFLRGSQKVIPYQEFWVFRRQGETWRLVTIERSHDSDRLNAANHIDGMTDLDRCNAEQGKENGTRTDF